MGGWGANRFRDRVWVGVKVGNTIRVKNSVLMGL